ncbi:MAG: hypothetical protein J0G29_01705 [Alphaproteobacteria bacterium]|nr:hypothetical protein [Alphaproteobacteria bacterium]OJV45454.1 MAG: hypothetical protein BGO28_04995 [Alphaproteobacteria bacterium 43-37]
MTSENSTIEPTSESGPQPETQLEPSSPSTPTTPNSPNQPDNLTIDPAPQSSEPPISQQFLSELTQEYQQQGTLSEERYQQLEKLGISKPFVDTYIKGVQSQANEAVQKAYAAVGGKETFEQMQQWATHNLSKEQILAFNEIVTTSPNMDAAILAIKGLYADYRQAQEPSLLQGKGSGHDTSVFESLAQVTEAIKDPRYEKDPAYRRAVESKLARSRVL